MAKIIAVANQKGGVGKTTTSVNLSAGLAILGKRVLLIDSDPQGNATSGFGINKSDLTITIYQVLIDNLAMEKAVLHTGYEVDLLPANIELAGAEIELVAAISRENRLKRSVDAVRDQYDFILIDCPPSLGLLTLNALTAADTVPMRVLCSGRFGAADEYDDIGSDQSESCLGSRGCSSDNVRFKNQSFGSGR